MDLTSIIGLVLGIAAVVGGQVLEGGSISAIIQPTAFIIVMGGTTGAVMLAFPGKDLKGAMASIKDIFFGGSKTDPKTLLEELVNMALKARKEGILALQADIKNMEDPFMRKGFELMTDGTDPNLLRDLLETEMFLAEEEAGRATKVWESAGGFTPTVGILGAVLGLIHVMENLSDPSKLGSGIAVAFVATVYGVGFANLVFIPMGTKIKFKHKQAEIAHTMMLEGIMAIQAGESPNFIREKLSIYIGGGHGGGDHGDDK